MSNELDELMSLEKQKVEWMLTNAIANGDCLECHLSRDKDGYCQVTVQYKNHRAHRLVFKHKKGPIEGVSVLHSCDNTCCINPEHLFSGTQQDNIDDMIVKGRKDTTPKRFFGETQAKQIAEMYEQGMSQREISDKLWVNQSTISRTLKRLKENANV